MSETERNTLGETERGNMSETGETARKLEV